MDLINEGIISILNNINNVTESFAYNVVRTNFDLNPEQEWTQAQKTRTINL